MVLPFEYFNLSRFCSPRPACVGEGQGVRGESLYRLSQHGGGSVKIVGIPQPKQRMEYLCQLTMITCFGATLPS